VWDDALEGAQRIDLDTTADPICAVAEAEPPDMILSAVQAGDDASTAESTPMSDMAGDATVPDGTVESTLADGDRSGGDSRTADDSGRNLVAYVQWATFAILCLLALVATFRSYFAASEAIRLWFSRDFVPVFQAAFNLVVLIASAIGISVLVRRLG
jgi:hypothetical protein